ncbi:MAG: hypothetical protein KGI38_12065 [Thaumarchaeota archaeon]|nr:hypothetical protein [Nitrososphaerota archaeon]
MDKLKELERENQGLREKVRNLTITNNRLRLELTRLKEWPDYGTSVLDD